MNRAVFDTNVLVSGLLGKRGAAPEPEVLKIIGEESKRNGTDKMTSRQIDRFIKSTRAQRTKR